MNNYLRNPRFNHQSEQASESALVGRNTDETEKRLGGAGEPPILLNPLSEKALTAAIWSLYESLVPTKESHEKRKIFANKIEKILNDEWPGKDIKVHMFGSSMNELGTTQSDVDLCVTTQWNGLKNIFHLSTCLAKHGMKIEQTVHKAKVPIVRLFDSKLELACDINVNNTLALHNTRLIRNYVEIDCRVRPLAMIVKHWARRRVLNDAAKGGTISTYTWTCIILNFLQMRDPPILPVLHDIPHEGVDPIMVNGEDASFCEDVEALSSFGSKNKETVGGLLFAFFRRMAFEFDYDKHVISLRHGKYLTKEEKGWVTCKGWKMLCVEEPFNTARNLGNSADDITVNGLREEFRRAYDILLYQNASLDKLCEEYHFPPDLHNNFYYQPYQNRYNNNNNNDKRVQSRRNNKINGIWNGNKPNNRKHCTKFNQQNGQNNCLNNSTDNFYDMSGKSNYSQDHQDDEEDGSNMRRFELRQNGHYEESIVEYSYRKHNDGSTRKQYDNIQNQNKRQIPYHNMPKDDEQLRPQTRKNYNSYIKKKNDDQFNNNYSQSQDSYSSICKNQVIESEWFTRYADTTSNQNQPIYKNNNQKVDNSSYNKNRPYSARGYSQNAHNYDSDSNKFNNYIRRPNTPSESDQKSMVVYNLHDQERRTYYNKSNLNKQEQIIDDSSSNPNSDRSNLAQISSSKPGNKSNKNRNHNKQIQPRYHKSAENTDFTNNSFSYIGDNISSNSISLPGAGVTVMVSIQSESILPPQIFHHRQSNDGPGNYMRRMSHQSSSDGSNSQTSGNTSNTSYSNSSSISTKNNYQKNNSNQNNYYQQQNQNKASFGKKRKFNNNNYGNGYNNSGNGNFRFNNNISNSSPVIALNCNDFNYQEMPFNSQSQMNQGQGHGHNGNDYNGNADINGYNKVHNGGNGGYNPNFRNYSNTNNNNNNNNASNWRNSNGNYTTNTKIINGSRNNTNNTNNGLKSVNNVSNFSNQSVNGNSSNNNYSRSNNNSNNHHLRNQNNNNNNVNLHKSINVNNYKSLDGNNNSNVQTKNFNNNNNYSSPIKNGGNNQIYNKKSNRNKNTRNTIKAENKEDSVNYQQQFPQEERQNYHNVQSHQQKKGGQNGQNNNSGKGKGYKKYFKQNVECQQQQ